MDDHRAKIILYKCPFCTMNILDGISSLIDHRQTDGHCDLIGAAMFEEKLAKEQK